MSIEERAVGIEDLLAHAGWARALARSLVRDASAADDALQDTWISALRSPPHDRRNLRGWIARAVASSAFQRKRAESRRARHEHSIAERDAMPTPEELVQELESQQLLASEVARLPEELRSTVLMRYYEARSAREIAVFAGISESAVRARLREALARLRTRLDERSGDRTTWLLALAPLARGTASSVAVAGPGALALPATGGLLMTLKSISIAAALLAAAAISWTVYRPRTEGVEPVAAAAPPGKSSVERETAPGIASSALESGEQPSRSADARSAASIAPALAAPANPLETSAPPAALSGRILVDGVARVPGGLRITAGSGFGPATIDQASSRYSIDSRPAEKWVELDREIADLSSGREWVNVESDETVPARFRIPAIARDGARHLDLELDASRRLRIQAVEATGRRPAADVELVYASHFVLERTVERILGKDHRVRRRTDAQGRCTFTGLPREGVVRLHAAGSNENSPVLTLELTAASPPDIEAEVVIGAPKATVHGRLSNPAADMQVLCSPVPKRPAIDNDLEVPVSRKACGAFRAGFRARGISSSGRPASSARLSCGSRSTLLSSTDRSSCRCPPPSAFLCISSTCRRIRW